MNSHESRWLKWESLLKSHKAQFLIEISDTTNAIKMTLNAMAEDPCVVDSVAGCGEVDGCAVDVRFVACVGVAWLLVCDIVVDGVCVDVLEVVDVTDVVVVGGLLVTEVVVGGLDVIGAWLVVDAGVVVSGVAELDDESWPVVVVAAWLEETVGRVVCSVVVLVVENSVVVVSCGCFVVILAVV